jgi:hypothetical protein
MNRLSITNFIRLRRIHYVRFCGHPDKLSGSLFTHSSRSDR